MKVETLVTLVRLIMHAKAVSRNCQHALSNQKNVVARVQSQDGGRLNVE